MSRAVYAEAAAAPSATHQCLAVTVLAAISQAALVAPERGDPLAPVVVLAILLALLGLLLRASVLWGLGRLGLARGPISLGSSLRPLSLAGAPGILYVLGAFLEPLGAQAHWAREWVLGPILGAWGLAATVVAVSCALHRGLAAAILLALLFRLGEREIGLLLAAR